jgi:hypothetical protein
MGPNTRIYNKFEWWSTDDCRCELCLYKGSQKRPCLLDECCCMEERAEALKREQGAMNGSTARAGEVPCRA